MSNRSRHSDGARIEAVTPYVLDIMKDEAEPLKAKSLCGIACRILNYIDPEHKRELGGDQAQLRRIITLTLEVLLREGDLLMEKVRGQIRVAVNPRNCVYAT